MMMVRKFASLDISCPYTNKGCVWRGSMGASGENYLRHITSCPRRREECKDCKQIVGWSSIAKDKHETICVGKLINCSDCKVELLRGQLEEHQEICREKLVYCPF